MDIIFFRPGLGSVSPAVTISWDGMVVDLLNRIVPLDSAVNFGGYAEEACADFVAALSADPTTAGLSPRTEVINLRLGWDRLDPLCPERAVDIPAWEEAMFAEIERVYAGIEDPRYQAVLVSLDPPHPVTRGGKLLCRRVDFRSERWEDGQPVWVVPPGAGEESRTKRRTRRT